MASNLIALRHRSRLYSSSSKLSSFSSYFSQINPKSQQSVDGIRKKLSDPSDAPLQSHSFHPNPNPNPNPSFQLSYIKESLQHIQTNKANNLGYRNRGSLMKSGVGNTNTSKSSRVFGAKEESSSSKFELAKPYSHAELGKKLKELRPKKNKEEEEEGWFSLSELQGRLGKLREIEEDEKEKEKEKSSKQMDMDGKAFRELRLGLKTIQTSKDQKSSMAAALKMDTSSEAGLMQSLPQPPKEHLIEKYFHPDNMSAAEKLKIELKKVRDEFKMSESDCGSARVQIGQLTTEIHHLSSVLHKKDKHSRRGLQAKVQQRKKLLKYLKRTDLDDYYFLLSKLGLRDNLDDKYAF